MKKILSISVIFLVVLVAIWSISRNTSYQIFGELISSVTTEKKVVALTFDDGPTVGKTEEILTVLGQHDVKATFFLVGEAIEQNQEQAKQIAAEGHEIGNHSYSHTRMVFKSQGFVSREIEETNRLIIKTGYSGPIHFRPPYGKKLISLPYYLSKTGMKSITWDIAPESDLPISSSASDIASNIVERVKPGSIVLLHIMFQSRKNSLASVPLVIKELKSRGYKFVTISELLTHESV